MRESSDKRKLQKMAKIESLPGLFLYKTDQIFSFKNATLRLNYVKENIVNEIESLLEIIEAEATNRISPEENFEDARSYLSKWESFQTELNAYTCVLHLRNLLNAIKERRYVSRYFAGLITKYRIEHINEKYDQLSTGLYSAKYKECRQYHTFHEYNQEFYDMLIEFYFVPYFMENSRALNRFISLINKTSWLLSIETDGRIIKFDCSSNKIESLEQTICEFNGFRNQLPEREGLRVLLEELIDKLIDVTKDPGNSEINQELIRNNIRNMISGLIIHIPFDTTGLDKEYVIYLTINKVVDLFEFVYEIKKWTWEDCSSNPLFVSRCIYYLNESICEVLKYSQLPLGESSDTYLEEMEYLESMKLYFNNEMRRILTDRKMDILFSNTIAPRSWFDSDCNFTNCIIEEGVVLEGHICGNRVLFHKNTSIICRNSDIEIVVLEKSEIPPGTILTPDASAKISYFPISNT